MPWSSQARLLVALLCAAALGLAARPAGAESVATEVPVGSESAAREIVPAVEAFELLDDPGVADAAAPEAAAALDELAELQDGFQSALARAGAFQIAAISAPPPGSVPLDSGISALRLKRDAEGLLNRIDGRLQSAGGGAGTSVSQVFSAPAEPQADSDVAGLRTLRGDVEQLVLRLDRFVQLGGGEEYDEPYTSDLYSALSADQRDGAPSAGYEYAGSPLEDAFRREPVEPRNSFAGIKLGPYDLSIRGSIGFTTGDATYDDLQRQQYDLREKLTHPSGRKYEFYQSYDLDHSFGNSGEFRFGARQEFPKFWADGTLKLKEEYRDYRDRDNRLNDRKEELFELRLDPRWNCGRWTGDIYYRHRIREYTTYSPLSYRLNQARLGLRRDWGGGLSQGITFRVDDYDYSFPSDRGSRKERLSTDLSWEANARLRLNSELSREEKTYSFRKTEDYRKTQLNVGANLRPDDRSSVDLRGSASEYEGLNDATLSYDETSADLRYQRELTDRLSGQATASVRDRSFSADPTQDISQTAGGVALNYSPTRDWNFYASADQSRYDYSLAVRSFDSQRLALGAGFTRGDLRVGLDLGATDNMYKTDSLRDYKLNHATANAEYSFGRHRLRGSLGRSELSQSNPASFNAYSEDSIAANWEFELSEEARLNFDFTSSRRDYAAQPAIDETRFEARLDFDL